MPLFHAVRMRLSPIFLLPMAQGRVRDFVLKGLHAPEGMKPPGRVRLILCRFPATIFPFKRLFLRFSSTFKPHVF